MQKIRIRNTEIEFNVQDTVYPFFENGVLFLRMIVLNYLDEPIEFISLMPQDILYRLSDYNQDTMDEITTAAEKAQIEQATWLATRENEKEELDDTTNDYNRSHYG